jgi:dethiobiotin synthetase
LAEFFVTGTDTDAGKTVVAAAMLQSGASRGLRTIGIKPLAAGCERRDGLWVNEDALLLQASATVRLDYPRVNPVALQTAMAPHLAAEREGMRLTAAPLIRHGLEVARIGHDLLVAEGAGGWFVPLNERETMADVAAGLRWPVILVVGMRLGCLNHALLTATAIRAAGLALAGWVANSRTAEMPALEANITTLDERLGAPRLGVVPWLGQRVDIAAAARHLDLSLLPGMADARL